MLLNYARILMCGFGLVNARAGRSAHHNPVEKPLATTGKRQGRKSDCCHVENMRMPLICVDVTKREVANAVRVNISS